MRTQMSMNFPFYLRFNVLRRQSTNASICGAFRLSEWTNYIEILIKKELWVYLVRLSSLSAVFLLPITMIYVPITKQLPLIRNTPTEAMSLYEI